MLRAWLGAHDLWVGGHSAAEGGGKRGGAGLTVPGHLTLPRGAAHRQRVDAVGVAVTIAVVVMEATVSRGPDEQCTQSLAALRGK